MYKLLELPHQQDIVALRRALWAHRIGHQVTEEEAVQVLWLADPRQRDEAAYLIEQWHRGELAERPAQAAKRRSPSMLGSAFTQAPLAAACVALCVVVFALMALFGDRVIAALTFVPVDSVSGRLTVGTLGDSLASGQIWRLVSPALMHFGWMHLVFNMLWLWYFGRQVEALQGPVRLIMLAVVAALVSNLAQYATGTVLFGGMSGVDYALLGYVWLMARRAPESGFFVPQMLVVFMLAWMVFTMTDMASLFGFGNVANEAHLGGLLVGLVSGWWAGGRAARGER
ncbi:rhomboid family intramembrane serine protease [Chromohalobacter sarecensis]|uniref:Rhomboid family intramembrane serine protease n=1 Tax=Chromohalobacter sarecensis TaxID=245294 RepID=A0ABV9D4Z7_9GAMM|nr:rhomboid family intramembrane serine protease [Chromohalobacter sarecensis]MCK0714141.1 rhomboid family intramembrane serine protease [Chromohalobacter sarecensis]